MMERRVESRFFESSFAGVNALQFVSKSMTRLAGTRTREWTLLESSTVTEGGEWEDHKVTTIAHYGDKELTFVATSTHMIMLTDGVAGLRTYETDRQLDFVSENLPQRRRLHLYEQKVRDGWARILEVTTDQPNVAEAISERFEQELANVSLIPHAKKRAMLLEEFERYARLLTYHPSYAELVSTCLHDLEALAPQDPETLRCKELAAALLRNRS